MPLFLVRHSVRADETKEDSDEWFCHSSRANAHDPWVPKSGKTLARDHARTYFAHGKHPHMPALTCVYSSPYRRCVETAAEIAEELGLPIKIMLALGASAAASVNHGLGNLKFLDLGHFQRTYPAITFLPPDSHHTPADGVDVAGLLQRVAAHHAADPARAHGAMVVVAHRETIRPLLPQYRRIPYCGTMRLHAIRAAPARAAPNPASGSVAPAFECVHTSFPVPGLTHETHAAGADADAAAAAASLPALPPPPQAGFQLAC